LSGEEGHGSRHGLILPWSWFQGHRRAGTSRPLYRRCGVAACQNPTGNGHFPHGTGFAL